MLSGILGVLAGIVCVFRPFSSAVALAWVLGIWLIVRGIVEIAAAFAHVHPRPRWLMVLVACCGSSPDSSSSPTPARAR